MAVHPPENLRAMLEHLDYEISMLHNAATLHALVGTGILGVICLESVLFHARILLSVLYMGDDHKDAVTAWHYVPDWEKRRRFTNETKAYFETTRLALNTRAAHLSIKRLCVSKDDEK